VFGGMIWISGIQDSAQWWLLVHTITILEYGCSVVTLCSFTSNCHRLRCTHLLPLTSGYI